MNFEIKDFIGKSLDKLEHDKELQNKFTNLKKIINDEGTALTYPKKASKYNEKICDIMHFLAGRYIKEYYSQEEFNNKAAVILLSYESSLFSSNREIAE